MDQLTEFTITYHLKQEHIDALKIMADENAAEGEGCDTVERLFNLMMTAGSWHDIESKIRSWQLLHENGKRNRAKAKAEGAA